MSSVYVYLNNNQKLLPCTQLKRTFHVTRLHGANMQAQDRLEIRDSVWGHVFIS